MQLSEIWKTFTCALFWVQLDLDQSKTVDNLLWDFCSLVQCGKNRHGTSMCSQMKSLIVCVCFLLSKAQTPQIMTPVARWQGLRHFPQNCLRCFIFYARVEGYILKEAFTQPLLFFSRKSHQEPECLGNFSGTEWKSSAQHKPGTMWNQHRPHRSGDNKTPAINRR